MQAGVSLSFALDLPGHLSPSVHIATVTSPLWASMPLWASLGLCTPPPPPPPSGLCTLAASCRSHGRGRRDTLVVFVAASTTSFQLSLALSCPSVPSLNRAGRPTVLSLLYN